MIFQFIDSIEQIEQSDWNALWSSQYPFTKYEFLHALESSGSTTESSGWQPYHLVGKENDQLVFVMPMYLKTHSYGEYVFDWAWADAYSRVGLEYYPKLVNAREKLIERKGCQFHWFNENYADFDEYLSHFSSRKRKNIRKERQKTSEFNIHIQAASERTLSDWEWFYQLYHRTYLKRSGRPGYLSQDFFTLLAKSLPDQLLLASAEYKNEKIAGAVYFKDDACLYGRYWGTSMDIDALHFETCYYRGIDYAIQHKLQRFDPGAQGEHKIQRGFQSVATCSYHWINNAEFRPAIEQFCAQEQEHNAHYIADARSYLPFKENVKTRPENSLIGD